MTLRIHSPEGAIGREPAFLAAAPAVLSGRRIAVLDNGKPGAELLLVSLAEQIAERSGAHFVGSRRKGSAATPCEEDLLDELRSSADLVLTGTAD